MLRRQDRKAQAPGGAARTAPSTGGQRGDLQGLRAVAVLLVALSHAGVGFLRGGYVGVDVFFVLSGFLITRLLLSRAARGGAVSFGDFYARRARRILPAATLTLVVTEIAAFVLLNLVRAKQTMVDSTWASLFVSNVYFAHQGTNYFAQNQPPSPVQNFWSLAVEEQFYLLWPALLSLAVFGALAKLSRRHSNTVDRNGVVRLFVVVVAIGLGSLAWSIHATASNPTSAYFSTLTRAWELAIGAALAVATSRQLSQSAVVTSWAGSLRARAVLGWIGIIGVLVAAVEYSGRTSFPGSAALLPTVGALLIIAVGIGAEPRFGVGRLLALAPLRYVGDRSYAFYLWHWPALIIASLYLGRSLGVGENLLLLVVAFLVSMLSYRFVENPIHRSSWRPQLSMVLWPASFVAVFLIGSFATNSLNAKAIELQAASERAAFHAESRQTAKATRAATKRAVVAAVAGRTLPSVIGAVRAAERGAKLPLGLEPPVSSLLNSSYNWPQSDCGAHDGQTSNTVCHFGDTASRHSIVLFGDSHAEMWMPAIISMAERDHWNVVPFSKSACTPEKWGDGRNWAECHAWYLWAVRTAEALRPAVLVISGCCGGYDGDTAQTVQDSFLGLAATMRPYVKHAVIIGDDVGVTEQPVDCLLRSHATMGTCTSVWPDDTFYMNQGLSTRARLDHVGFIDTSGWFCWRNHCPMVVGRTVVYADTGHITAQYAEQMAAPFRAAFVGAVGALEKARSVEDAARRK